MSYQSFIIPRHIYFGWGSLEQLKKLEGQRAVIVTDQIMKKLGFIQKVQDYLKEAGIESFVFDEVEPDPSRQTVKKGAAFMTEKQPDLVIGLGGGSCIDAGKGMWIFYEYPDAVWEDLFVPFTGVPPLRKKAKYVAIPSTSGTATEVTLAAVVTNRDIQPNKKDFTLSYEVTPDMAICDPELPMTMPPAITANTGFDVLVHATESYVSKGASDLTDFICPAIVKGVFKWLPLAYANGEDKLAREKMHNLSLGAGFTFTNTALGLCHSTAHALGAEYRIPHGLGNAVMLPYVVQHNMSAAAEKYSHLAQALGYSFSNVMEGARKFIDGLIELKKQVSLAMTIKELGVDEAVFMRDLDKVVQNAMDDGSTPTNPRVATHEDVKKIMLCAYHGREVL